MHQPNFESGEGLWTMTPKNHHVTISKGYLGFCQGTFNGVP